MTIVDATPLTDVPDVFREAYALHVLYHAMGVPIEDVFLSFGVLSPVTEHAEIAIVAKRGELTFSFCLGPVGMPDDVFRARWAEYAREINAASPEVRGLATDGTEVRRRSIEIMAGMIAKGFTPPRLGSRA